MPSQYLLIDCNNFFASCERIFRPDWHNRPLIVLSSNDGCIVARSPESKKLGFLMGEPYFKVKEKIRLHNVVVCSSNFSLYSDISRRVMNSLEPFSSHMEVYSIDEAFLRFDHNESEELLTQISQEIIHTIKSHIGIDVSIGIAPTKTLAKLANYAAKRCGSAPFLESYYNEEYRRDELAHVPVEEIWGVGKRLSPKLRSLGIRTIGQFIRHPEPIIKKHFGVVGARIQLEIQGISCFDKLDTYEQRQQIMSSRSFGEYVQSKEELKQSLHYHLDAACRQLRKEQLCAKVLTILIRAGSIHQTNDVYYERTATFQLDNPSDSTHTFGKIASILLEDIWRPGLKYKKSGVILTDLCPNNCIQLTLSPSTESPQQRKLMETLDQLKAKGHIVQFASQGITQKWATKRSLSTPGYTTRWSDIPVVY